MTDKSTDTKMKIMESARILFADRGFEGTSIRDIAKAADVNVASINYHFSSKENLLMEIMQASYNGCSRELGELYEKCGGALEDAMISFFNFFLVNSYDIVSYFKLMMSSQHSHHIPNQNEDNFYGPPGGKLIAQAILKEVGAGVPDEDLHWGLKTLFSHIVHLSIVHNCCLKAHQEVPFSKKEHLEKGIRKLTRLVLQELKSLSR